MLNEMVEKGFLGELFLHLLLCDENKSHLKEETIFILAGIQTHARLLRRRALYLCATHKLA